MSNSLTKTILGVSVLAAMAIFVKLFWPGEAPPGTATLVEVSEHAASSLPTIEASPSAARPSDSTRIQDLEKRLAQERRAREKAEADAKALRAKIAPLEGTIVVSLGKIEDIGKRTGSILPALAEMHALDARDHATLSADEKSRLLDLQRQYADVLGMLPEIAGFQDNPAEYGSFFRNMIQQAAGLNDAQAGQIESYMRERGTNMNQLGLNSANKPTDPNLQGPWEANRDQFNEQTAAGLRALVSPPVADKAGINSQLMELLEKDFDKAAGNSSTTNK